MKTTFYGVRGSIPTPSRKDFETGKYGGNTTCLTCELDKHTIIFDAGSGISVYGSKTKKQHFLLFFTHFHHDHVQGFPFFSPVYNPKCSIYYFSPRIMGTDLEARMEEQFNPPLFPYRFQYTFSKKHYSIISPQYSVRLVDISSKKEFQEVFDPNHENPTLVDLYMTEFPQGINAYRYVLKSEPPIPYEVARIDFAENRSHPDWGSYSYKVTAKNKSMVFITDLEQRINGYEVLLNLSNNADMLIHDAQYLPEDYHKYQDFGHSTYEMACAFAKKANVKCLFLTHYDPLHDDHQIDEIVERAREFTERIEGSYQVEGAKEGVEIDI